MWFWFLGGFNFEIPDSDFAAAAAAAAAAATAATAAAATAAGHLASSKGEGQKETQDEGRGGLGGFK